MNCSKMLGSNFIFFARRALKGILTLLEIRDDHKRNAMLSLYNCFLFRLNVLCSEALNNIFIELI